jgi:perosamine synthetase
MIPIYKPYFPAKSLSYAHEAIDSTWISSHGKFLSLAEEKLKEITTSKYIILTNNGTTATHLVACGLKFKYPEIQRLVVPSNVYVAAWNMFKINPIYDFDPVDANLNTWNFEWDVEYMKFNYYLTRGFKVGVLAVHNLGNIINVPKIKERYPDIPIVEDNCEGFLGSYEGKPSGTASLAYSISFFGNKTITSGEGGAFCTDDEEVYNEMNRVRAHGITSKKFVFSELGYNYRMTNVQAALLYGQLEILPEILEKKRNIFNLYKKELDHELIRFMESEAGVENPNWMFGARFDLSKEKMDQLQLHLHYNDIETRPMFPPINDHSHYSHFDEMFRISRQLYETVLILPSYPELTETEVKYICKTIKYFLKK